MNIIKKGFTLIELLVVIGILAVLMAGVVALIDPVDKNRQANDARIQSLVANAATAEEAYAAQHDGCYAADWNALFAAGELKIQTPQVPNGYALPVFTSPTGSSVCTAPEVDDIIVSGTMMSKKYIAPGTTVWQYTSTDASTCAVAAIGDACP
jgi:prepilin-type N-terminal cleavage/methylation domain-containing protein